MQSVMTHRCQQTPILVRLSVSSATNVIPKSQISLSLFFFFFTFTHSESLSFTYVLLSWLSVSEDYTVNTRELLQKLTAEHQHLSLMSWNSNIIRKCVYLLVFLQRWFNEHHSLFHRATVRSERRGQIFRFWFRLRSPVFPLVSVYRGNYIK